MTKAGTSMKTASPNGTSDAAPDEAHLIREKSPLARLLSAGRYFILIPGLSAFFGAVALMVYAGLTVINVSTKFFTAADFSKTGAKEYSIFLIELIDLLLLSTVLYVVSVGLYVLFLGALDIPAWLKLRDLDDLKAKVVGVIVLLLTVTFLGQASVNKSGPDVLYLGIGIAVVVAALALSMGRTIRSEDKKGPPKPE